jgi:hypothetical protein
MDIRCPICGEPWDADSLHDEVAERYPNKPWYTVEEPENKRVYDRIDTKTGLWYNHTIYEEYYKEVKDQFFKRGCRIFGTSHNEETISKEKNSVYAMIAEVMGDDIDAIASATEDFDYMMDMQDD